MSNQILKLSENAVQRIKEIMTLNKNKAVGVRIGVKSGGCAGMSYVMEYAEDVKPNEEVIEEKGIKVFIDPKAIMYLWELRWITKKINFHHNLFLKILTRQSDVVVVSLLKFNY